MNFLKVKVPIESHTLNTLTAHTETNQEIVIKKLIDWFLYKYKKHKIQKIHQKAKNKRLKR